MKSGRQFAIVLVTAPNRATARKLARLVLGSRLAACANLISNIESHYWWRGKLESSAEVLLLFKTDQRRLKALEKLVLDHHPYETPEVVALDFLSGTSKYLDWIKNSVALESRR